MTQYSIRRMIYCQKEGDDVYVNMNCRYCEHCKQYDLRKNSVDCNYANAVFPPRDPNEISSYIVTLSVKFEVTGTTEDEIGRQLTDAMRPLQNVTNRENWKFIESSGKTKRKEE